MLQCETCNWYWWCYCVCVRLPRPGSRASSRASSRADWCVTPNAYHREEMDDPNSNRKVTRVCYVTWVTLNAVLVVQSVTVIVACWCVSVCVCVKYFICVVDYSVVNFDAEWFQVTHLLSLLTLLCYQTVIFAAYNLYRTLALSLRAEHISVLMSGMENSGCVRWYVYETWSVMKEMAPCCTEQRMMRCLWCKIERQVFCVGLKQKLRTWDVIPMLLEIFWGYVVNGHVLTKRVIGWKGVWNMT